MPKISKEKVVKRMIKKNLSWTELSREMGVTPSSLRSIFRRDHNQPKTVYKLSRVLGVDPEEILE